MNTLLVLGSERLHIEMSRRFQTYRTSRGEDLTILKVDKSGGCVDRDEEYVIIGPISYLRKSQTNYILTDSCVKQERQPFESISSAIQTEH